MNCKQCDVVITTATHIFFCSKHCYNRYHYLKRKDNVRMKKPCIICGKQITIKAYESKNKRYCGNCKTLPNTKEFRNNKQVDKNNMNLPMKWSEMSQEMREWFLSKAGMNTTIAHSGWSDIAEWQRGYIKDAVDSTHIKLIEE